MARFRDRPYFRGLTLVCSIAIAPGETLLYGHAPEPVNTAGNRQEQLMSAGQLESLVAPIALYPDSLLAQILAASTYPLEIVTARRWVEQNAKLKGKQLVEAAGKQDWDPSIQALVAFPTVLQMMDRSLDWTTELGNAFLAQQSDVMAAVQRLRKKAQQSGKLQSNAQQHVESAAADGQTAIVIQPADPQVMYVPSYDPAAVYGAAPAYYPYPPVFYPAEPVFAAGAISFGLGIAVGAIFNGCCGGGWGWGWGCNWGPRASLFVNNNFFIHNRNAFVNRANWGNAYRGNGRAGWTHNPRYRGAVPYTNRSVASRYNGGRPGSMRPAPQPANIGNIRPPGSRGSASRLQGNAGVNRGGRGSASHLPAYAGAGRGGAGHAGRGQMPAARGSANRAGPRRQWGGWAESSRVSPGNRGGAFGGGGARQARGFGNRGFRGGGGGGFRGGGRGGGRRR